MNKLFKILLINTAFIGSLWAIDLPFSKAIEVDNTLYLSGEIAYDPKLKKVVSGGIEAETKKVLSNIESTLKSNGYSKNDVVKCMVMLKDMKDFKKFNSVYKEFFQKPYPTRSTFAVANLALNAKIEIECLAIKK